MMWLDALAEEDSAGAFGVTDRSGCEDRFV
jgi:hypothetical protein